MNRTKTPGSVVVYGTPGEEMMPPNAKTDMLKAVFSRAPTSSFESRLADMIVGPTRRESLEISGRG
ncbi:MAG: hypothetical protein ABSB35_27115 [Bryobacteraceae bacterium]|jgi:hypothetical protein